MKKLLGKPILFGFITMELFLFTRILTDQLCTAYLPQWLFSFCACILEVSLISLFALWIKKQLAGAFFIDFRTDRIKKSALLLTPLYAALLLNILSLLSAVSHFGGCFPVDKILPTLSSAFFASLRAGISEELIFRVCILGCMMHQWADQPQRITASVWLSAGFFSLAHLSNLGNHSLAATLVQTVYCLSTGALLGAAYVRTRSILPSILLHTFVDFFSFIQTALYPDSIHTENATAYLLIYIGLSLFWFICASFILHRRNFRSIQQLWSNQATLK